MGIETLFYVLYRLVHPIIAVLTGEGPLAFWKTESFAPLLTWYKVFAGIISALLFCGLVYVAYRMIIVGTEVSQRERDAKKGAKRESSVSIETQRWARIMEKINSENEADWKVAILEADAILEDIVGTMNLAGLSMGDKLKNVEPSDFLTLESAWEAHKTRNAIAHDIDGVPLSRREAQRVIALYEKVLREFKYL